ncbi:MAG: GntR family transcriptional regulator [Pseudonocardiaceae bacterium]
MPEPAGPAFPYHRIVDDLRSAIVAGRLAPGERVSSEWELAQRYQTNRPTVRRAVGGHRRELSPASRRGRSGL